MAYYSKASVRILASDNSDYSDPVVDTKVLSETATTATAWMSGKRSIPFAAATTLLALGGWTTISSLLIQNHNATNYVTVSYTGSTGAGVLSQVVEPGGVFLTTNIGSATAITIQANAAPCICTVVMLGVA